MQSLPTDLAVKLRERKPAAAKEAAGWADDYGQAHREEGQTGGQMKQPTSPAPWDEASLQHKSFSKRGNAKKGTAGSAMSSFRSKTKSKGSCSVSSAEIGAILQVFALKGKLLMQKQTSSQLC